MSVAALVSSARGWHGRADPARAGGHGARPARRLGHGRRRSSSSSRPPPTGSTAASPAAGASPRTLGVVPRHDGRQAARHRRADRARRRRPRLAVDRAGHHRPRVHDPRPARRRRRRAARVMEPSMLGKWKATIQFVAITLAMLRPDVIIARRLPRRVGDGRRRGRHRLVGRRLPAERSPPRCAAAYVSRGLRHRRQRGDRRRARRAPASQRGDEVVALARSDAAAAKLAERAARSVVRGDTARRGRARARHGRAARWSSTSPASTRSASSDPEPMLRVNVDGAVAAVRAAARAGAAARVVHTSSAATLGEAPGTVGREDTPHRGWYLSTYERTKTEGERAVARRGAARPASTSSSSTRRRSRGPAAPAAPGGS